MGLFDFLKKKKADETSYSRVMGLDWYSPVYSQFGNNIYASDIVQQCLNCIVREMKKLTPLHILKKDKNYMEHLQDDIQSVLDNPNPLMTTTDFIEKFLWQLLFNYNSFILPTWENGKLTGLFPLQPKQVDFIQDSRGELFVKFDFANGYSSTIPYADIIHIRYNYSVSEFMGGNEFGQPDHKALLESLELNNTLLKGVAKALNSSFAINGIIKYNSMIDGKKTEDAVKELTKRLQNNESGFLPLDMKGEFIPFSRQVQLVDEATLKFIDEKILRHFGVPLNILTGKYTKEEYEAFFQKTLEPIIISISQAFTKTIFSKRESFGFGHKIIFSHKELDFMTMNEKHLWATLLSNIGGITVNEVRAMIGYGPVADNEIGNMLVMSKNYGNVQSVKNMDLNNGGDENEQ